MVAVTGDQPQEREASGEADQARNDEAGAPAKGGNEERRGTRGEGRTKVAPHPVDPKLAPELLGVGHQHRRANRVVDRREYAQDEEPEREGGRGRGGREPETGAAAAKEERSEQIAPAGTVGQPTGGKGEEAEGDEGTCREADQLRVGQAPLRRDRDVRGWEDEEHEMVESVREVHERHGALGERLGGQGSGAIVNNASVGALTGNPGIASYIASKHRVVGLTRTAALEYVKRGIRVNAVNPGLIDTQIARDVVDKDEQAYAELAKHVPIGRAGRPEEIASVVLWLCSPGASYVVGHALTVDGGMTVP